MRKLIFSIVLLTTVMVHADIFEPLLSGEYNAATLSVAEQDSILNPDALHIGRYSLEYENAEQLFRRSQLADWYIVDTMRHTRKKLGAGLNLGKVRDAVMSPNGRYVAFAKDNNLYIHKLDFGTEIAVTKDQNPDIINGISDWLYEEEFGTTALFAWSPDSKQLAFVRLDETAVPSFSWQTYLNKSDAANDSTAVTYPQYPSADTLRYPKAGCTNAKASVCVYDVATKAIQTMQVNNDQADVYFPRLRWTNPVEKSKGKQEPADLLVLRVNRDQTRMDVLSCNARSTVAHLLYKEESKHFFMDYELFDQWVWLADNSFVVLSESDGWRRAYLYTSQGLLQKTLTPEGIDVTAVYAVDETTQTLYYQAAPTPSTRQIYAASIKSATKNQPAQTVQLTKGDGFHSARLSKDAKKMIECYQSFDTPNQYTLYSLKGTKAIFVKTVLSNEKLAADWKALQLKEPRLMTIPNADGQELEVMMLYPKDYTEGTQYPLVVMHYSGPQSQRVLNRWRKRFEYVLAEQGYMVMIVDTRGGDCRGRTWRNETYMNLGVKEAQDLIAAAQWAGNQPYVDAERMAILGWSYGGYQTLMTMSTVGHPFKAGVAIAPVTDWKLYDTGYTERFMRRPQVNGRGYQNASLMNHVADLSGNVLIVHGMADDNVHVQHTMQYIDALIRADKQFEMQLYPDDNHFLRNGKNYTHMHRRLLNFLQRNL